MAGLIYFAADRKGVLAADLAAWGLAPVFDGAPIHQREVLRTVGPGSACGVIFRPLTHEPRQPVLGCWPPASERPEARQTWQPLIGADGVWIGHYTDQPPTPADLARPEQVAGHWTRLEDDQEWLIPAAHTFPEGTAFPQTMRLGADGWERESLPRYADLERRAAEFYQACQGGEAPPCMEWADTACDALAVNYRIDRRGVGHLRILSTRSIDRLLGALIDGPTIAAATAQLAARKAPDAPEAAPAPDGEATADATPEATP